MILVSKVRKSMILIPSQDFAGEDGTMAEAMMRTTSLSNVSHVDRVEDTMCSGKIDT